MDLQNAISAGQAAAQPAQHSAPPPAVPDGRVSADASAINKDPTSEVPLPIPASSSQSGFVSKAALADHDVAPKLDTSDVSAVQRTLKPYGINMLPEKHEAPMQDTPSKS
jgi:hypothetical protein